MIKKNTIAIFKENNRERTEELTGGIPLSVGEIMTINTNSQPVKWKVIDKKIELTNEVDDQIVDVTYAFERV